MTANEWAAIGEVTSAIFTLLGVITSLYMAVKALREVQKDRRIGQAPYLAFEPGGYRYPIEFTKVKQGTQKQDSQLPENAETVGLKTDNGKVTFQYGKLRNYGLGPAIHARIVWIPSEIRIGSERFEIDNKKLLESKYSRKSNTIPSSPGHILPNQEAQFFRLPTFIHLDYEKKVSEVRGVIEIECLDVFKQRHVIQQDFIISTGYKEEPPYIHFLFSDLRLDVSSETNP